MIPSRAAAYLVWEAHIDREADIDNSERNGYRAANLYPTISAKTLPGITRESRMTHQPGAAFSAGHARLAPQGGEHGDDLLFAAHDLRQEDGVILGAGIEGLTDGLVVAYVNQLGAFHQHIGEH